MKLKTVKMDPLQRKKAAQKLGSVIFSVFRVFFLLSVGYIIIYPLLSMISYSLISRVDLYDPSIVWVPKHFTGSNYTVAIEALDYFQSLYCFGDSFYLFAEFTEKLVDFTADYRFEI